MILLDDKETNLIRGVSAQRNMALLEQGEITNIEFVDRQNRTQNKAQLKKVVDFLMDYGEERTLEEYWKLTKEIE